MTLEIWKVRESCISLMTQLLPLIFIVVLANSAFAADQNTNPPTGTGATECATFRDSNGHDLHWADFAKWGRVPLNIHAGALKGFTQDQLCFIAANSDFVTIEKSHGVITTACGNTTQRSCKRPVEDGFYEAAARLKKLNSNLKILFYFNAAIKYSNYRGYDVPVPRENLDPAQGGKWLLRNDAGDIVFEGDKKLLPLFDVSNSELREWWTDYVVSVIQASPDTVDGIFADAFSKHISKQVLSGIGLTQEARRSAIAQGAQSMMEMAKRKMDQRLGKGKLLVINGLQGAERRDYEKFLTWKGVDGIMDEHFDVRQKKRKEEIKADLDLFSIAQKHNKFIILKAWPGFDWQSKRVTHEAHATLVDASRAALSFPLAAFLIAATENSKFAYSWGYRESDGMFAEYPWLSRDFGPARGPAQWKGYTATRKFSCAEVTLNLYQKTGKIDLIPQCSSKGKTADWTLSP